MPDLRCPHCRCWPEEEGHWDDCLVPEMEHLQAQVETLSSVVRTQLGEDALNEILAGAE